MSSFLDVTLFHISGKPVTVGNLAVFLAILIGSYVAARLFRRLVAIRLLKHSGIGIGVRYALGRFTGYAILFVGAVLSLETLGINLATLAVFGGAIGIGIGVGLQDIAKNFISGLILLLERPIQVGDRIEIGNISGDVTEIRMRATVIRTNDDVHLIVPNSKFISDTVTNRSFGRPRVRYKVPVGVGYGSSPRQVEEALLAAATRSESVLKDPPPGVWFTGFGDSSLDFELLCWTEKMLHRPGVFRSELNYLIHEELTHRGIEIPFPQRDLHIRSVQGLRVVSAVDSEASGKPGTKPADPETSGGEQ